MNSQYSIKAAAQMAELTVDTLRAWERRYAAVEPDRSEKGRRLYSDAEVERLSLLKRATDHGHPISMVAPLSNEELRELLKKAARETSNGGETVARLMGFVMSDDFDAFERTLGQAAVALPPRQLIDEIFFPLLQQVGDAWFEGKLTIAQEHAVSSNLRSLIGAMIRLFHQGGSGPSILFSTLSGERHEFGILLLALLASSEGVGCHYLGPDLPVEEIARSVFATGAEIVALSFVHGGDIAKEEEKLRSLHAKIAPHASLWVGGAAATALKKNLQDLPIVFMESHSEFDRHIAMLKREPSKAMKRGRS